MTIPAFARNLKTLREDRDLTQEQLAETLGVSRVAIWNWETGNTQPNRPEIISAIKSVFDVQDSDLFGYQDGFYAQYHNLTTAPPGAIVPSEPRKAYAPLLGRIHAGDAQEPDILDSSIPLPYEIWESHKNGYFLQVEGTCMNKVYNEGCYVFIDPDKAPQNGSIAVVSIDNNDFIMRRLLRGSTALILAPESFDDKWSDIVISDDAYNVQFVGTVVWFQSNKELE